MRCLELTTRGTAVHLDGSLLRIERPEMPVRKILIEDIDLLVVEAAQAMLSGAALAALGAAGVPVMLCCQRHLPTAWLTPTGSRPPVHPDRARAQSGLLQRTADRLWKDIIEVKIARQADVLKTFGLPHAPVQRLADAVLPGDSDNREAVAASIYWRSLLGDIGTRRDGGPTSQALDWGYTVLRAVTARSLVAVGLHPGIALKHRGETDPFPLAADLMEPYRPAVDLIVRAIAPALETLKPPEWKVEVVGLTELPVRLKGQTWSLRSAMMETAQSLARVIDEGKGFLALPTQLGGADHARRLSENVAPRLL
jgi:CRISPR-associated protein Cas1